MGWRGANDAYSPCDGSDCRQHSAMLSPTALTASLAGSGRGSSLCCHMYQRPQTDTPTVPSLSSVPPKVCWTCRGVAHSARKSGCLGRQRQQACARTVGSTLDAWRAAAAGAWAALCSAGLACLAGAAPLCWGLLMASAAAGEWAGSLGALGFAKGAQREVGDWQQLSRTEISPAKVLESTHPLLLMQVPAGGAASRLQLPPIPLLVPLQLFF